MAVRIEKTFQVQEPIDKVWQLLSDPRNVAGCVPGAQITEAVDEAYHIGDTLIFLREYPAEHVAMDGRLQSENPKILEALKQISAGV